MNLVAPSSAGSPCPSGQPPSLLWRISLGSTPRGVTLAREKGWLLAWDDQDWLHLYDRLGQRQGHVRVPGPLAAACAADDGSALAAVGSRGQVWFLAPDLTVRWEHHLGVAAAAAALDPFGQYLAVADIRARLIVFDRLGRRRVEVQCPRPLHRLAFIPVRPNLVGASDVGLVACWTIDGALVWQDRVVAHINDLSVNDDGEQVCLACFSEGLRRFSLTKRALGPIPAAGVCRLAAQSFSGQRILVADLDNGLAALDPQGTIQATCSVDEPPLALAVTPLGEGFVAAFPSGTVAAYRW